MERVSVYQGEIPILLVAPHGNSDKNTDLLVEQISSEMGAFAVINRGWRRSKKYNYSYEFADCNNIEHVHQDVVKEEFLDQILRISAKIQKKIDKRVFVLNIHGCKNENREKINDQNLDIVLGYGEGYPSSYTCDLRIKNAFAYFLEKERFGIYEGKKRLAGRSKNNLNQLFKIWYPNKNVHSIQVEIVEELRENESMIQITSDGIISALDELLVFDDTTVIERDPNYF